MTDYADGGTLHATQTTTATPGEWVLIRDPDVPPGWTLDETMFFLASKDVHSPHTPEGTDTDPR